MKRFLPLVLIAVCGCQKNDDPFEVGTSWLYNIDDGVHHYQTHIRVSRNLTVFNNKGFELSGPMGVSRLVILNDICYASQLSGSTFDPPLPIFKLAPIGGPEDKIVKVQDWEGRLIFLKDSQSARATLTQSWRKDIHNGVKVRAYFATLELRTARRMLQLRTEFIPAVGIKAQEQRTDQTYDYRLEMLKKE